MDQIEKKPKVEKPTLEITLANPNDAEIMCKIRDEAWLDTYPNEELDITREDIRINAEGPNGEHIQRRIKWLKDQIANQGENWTAYIGKIDGAIRGFVIASTDENGRKFLNSIYVKPGYQGKGLGSKLMKQALVWLGEDEDIFLEVTSYNDNAINFYKRLGFVKTNAVVPDDLDQPDYITPVPQIEMVLPHK